MHKIWKGFALPDSLNLSSSNPYGFKSIYFETVYLETGYFETVYLETIL